MDLDAYRRSAEAFSHALTAEYYRHYAGLKGDYAIEPIYERHADLFSRGAVERIRERSGEPPPESDERRRRSMLLEFAIEGHLGLATRTLDAELARREAELSIELDGERLGFRESTVAQANEADADRRAAIERARLTVTAQELNPLYREVLELQHELSRSLGWSSYRAMCAEVKRLDLDGLGAQTAAFSAATAGAYPELLEPELQRTLGLGLAELRRSDLPRFFRAAESDEGFPRDLLVPSLLDTLAGLGIDLAAQPGVSLDVEPRPKKSPRAFCAPVRVPGEVYLVISPVGGQDDFEALFHEAGHTEHFAHMAAGLEFEFRHLGDNGVTEAFAFLFQHLTENPEWLERHLPGVDAAPALAHARARRLIYLRRYAAKLAYELELHGDPPDPGIDRRYAERLGDALGVQHPTETYLADVDPGFYSAAYLRAWALETHLRRYLQDSFGPAWFASPAAGDTLKALWSEGQRQSAEELLHDLTGETLRFDVLLDDLRLPGRAA
jgi:hypothetical protein